tara:strand:- start:1327 stop:2073 length:747 start_codon:yes stop_codon:yes gene_type:complete
MLWVFGDSFAGNFCRFNDESRMEKEYPYKEYTWQYLLAQKYKHDFKLKGLGGGCNEDTFKVITKYLHKIKPGDIVLTILTSPNRQLEVTEDKYTFGDAGHYTYTLYNDPPPEGHPIVTSHFANKTEDDEIEACRFLRMSNFNTSKRIQDAWLHWTLDYWQSFVNYFSGIGVKCVGSGFGALSENLHYNYFLTLHESYRCDCKHFTRKGHKYNFTILDYALQNNLNYIDLKYILQNYPKDKLPELKTSK